MISEEYLSDVKRLLDGLVHEFTKRNDRAHVKQNNSTHIQHLLDYGRITKLEAREPVTNLSTKARDYQCTTTPTR